MRASQPNVRKNMPSALAEGSSSRGRKLILKAANDNRPSWGYRLKKGLFFAGPVVAVLFFGLIWFMS
ncbi:MAG: hypothetical protein ACJAYR_003227 [Sneathiella sp.]|jgi:hypothetical protein